MSPVGWPLFPPLNRSDCSVDVVVSPAASCLLCNWAEKFQGLLTGFYVRNRVWGNPELGRRSVRGVLSGHSQQNDCESFHACIMRGWHQSYQGHDCPYNSSKSTPTTPQSINCLKCRRCLIFCLVVQSFIGCWLTPLVYFQNLCLDISLAFGGGSPCRRFWFSAETFHRIAFYFLQSSRHQPLA